MKKSGASLRSVAADMFAPRNLRGPLLSPHPGSLRNRVLSSDNLPWGWWVLSQTQWSKVGYLSTSPSPCAKPTVPVFKASPGVQPKPGTWRHARLVHFSYAQASHYVPSPLPSSPSASQALVILPGLLQSQRNDLSPPLSFPALTHRWPAQASSSHFSLPLG